VHNFSREAAHRHTEWQTNRTDHITFTEIVTDGNEQRLDGFSTHLHQMKSLRCYSLTVVYPMKIGPQKIS